RRYGHRRVIDDTEGDREYEQRLVARADIHENHERQASKNIDRSKQRWAVHAIGEPTRHDHSAEVYCGQHAVRGSARQCRKSAKYRIGNEMRFYNACCGVTAEQEAPEQGMEDRLPYQVLDLRSDVGRPHLRIARLVGLCRTVEQSPEKRDEKETAQGQCEEAPAP